ncbi:MAG: hypothetical protein ABSG15_10045 [FCB group bacterium]
MNSYTLISSLSQQKPFRLLFTKYIYTKNPKVFRIPIYRVPDEGLEIM